MAKLSIRDLDVAGKRVLMRVDFNVPLDDACRITDDTRIKAALPTIEYLVEQGAKVVLMSHLGRPERQWTPDLSLAPVAARLDELTSAQVGFVNECSGEKVTAAVDALEAGGILLLENVRNVRFTYADDGAGAQKKFAKALAEFGDHFVNDAFGTAHRAHASNVGVAEAIRKNGGSAAMGFLIEKELEFLVDKLEDPARPFVVIMGGAKVSDKIEVLNRLMEKADSFIIGGAMATTFRLAQGHEVGKSFAERDEEKLELARDILRRAEEKNTPFLLPADTRHCAEFEDDAPTECTDPWDEGGAIPADREGIDIGDRAIEEFSARIAEAGTIVWNGPMGVFEKRGFDIGTRAIGAAIAANDSAIKIVGGGDSVTAANQFGFGESMDHMSTGGGASLELLEGKELPGIAALSEA